MTARPTPTEPVFLNGRYTYPCGYVSDYRCETAEKAKLFDRLDGMVKEFGVHPDKFAEWLEEYSQ